MRGNWFQTYSGKTFYPLDPRPEEIDIADIAHALSNICRYGGHCKQHYSVAQHSVYVSLLVERREPDSALWALLHDAAEAYIGDMVRPLKESHAMRSFGDIEAGIMIAVARRFGLEFPEPEIVREFDRRICFAEAEVLMHGGNKLWNNVCDPLAREDWPIRTLTALHEAVGIRADMPFVRMEPAAARAMFERQFKALTLARMAARTRRNNGDQE